MSQEPAHAVRDRRDSFTSAAILVASVVGVFATWLPWHSLVHGMVEVRGIERAEGKVLVAALGLATLLAGYHLLARGPLFVRALTIATTVAMGAAGAYVYAMAKPESSLHEFVRTALEGTFCPGILLESLATLTAFVMAVDAWRLSWRARS